jgi:hypothetical protein
VAGSRGTRRQTVITDLRGWNSRGRVAGVGVRVLLQGVARRPDGAKNGANAGAWIEFLAVDWYNWTAVSGRELELRDRRQPGVEPCVCLGGRAPQPAVLAHSPAHHAAIATRSFSRRGRYKFYGCSYMFHLSGNNRRNSHFMGS